MKKILFLILITFNSFAIDCSLRSSALTQNKSVSKSFDLVFDKVTNSNSAEFILPSGDKLKLRYERIGRFEPYFDFIFADLELLEHKGGNGYTVISSISSQSSNLGPGILKFNLNNIFGDRSESVDYQSSERIELQNYILECFIL